MIERGGKMAVGLRLFLSFLFFFFFQFDGDAFGSERELAIYSRRKKSVSDIFHGEEDNAKRSRETCQKEL